MVAQLRAAEKVFKVGEKFFKTNSKSIMNFIRGKGYKPLTKAQAAANLSKSKKLTKKLASKLDDKGIPQVPTSAITKTASKIKPKTKLTKEQMVRTISDKPRPRLPKDQIPKPPSNKVPAVRTSSPKAPNPTKEYLKKQGFKKSSGNVPVKRAGSSLTAPQKMKLSGLKKKGRLRDTIVPLTVGTIAASQLGGGPKSGESKTVRKKKRKPVVGGSSSSTSNINLQGGQGGLGTGTQGSGKLNTSNINLQGGQGGLGTGTQGSRESLSKQEKAFADSRGGLKAFAPGKIEKGLATLGGGKMRDARTSLEDTFYSDIKDRMNKDGGEVSAYEENYVKNFRKSKGGKVSKKKGGMVKRSYGGKVKRNMGGMVSPRKKVVFRRGGGRALRGMGKAIYSNKMY